MLPLQTTKEHKITLFWEDATVKQQQPCHYYEIILLTSWGHFLDEMFLL